MLHYTPGQGDPVSAGNPDGAGYFMRFRAYHRYLPPISNKEIIAQVTASWNSRCFNFGQLRNFGWYIHCDRIHIMGERPFLPCVVLVAHPAR